MVISTCISFIPRLISIMGIIQIYTIPNDRRGQNHGHTFFREVVDVDDKFLVLFKFFGGEIHDYEGKKHISNLNLVMSRLFWSAENDFVPLLFPPHTDNLSE